MCKRLVHISQTPWPLGITIWLNSSQYIGLATKWKPHAPLPGLTYKSLHSDSSCAYPWFNMDEHRDLGSHGGKYIVQEKIIICASWWPLGRKLPVGQEHCLGLYTKKNNYIFWHIIFLSVFTLTPSISISIVCQTKFFGNKYKYQGHSFISFYNTLITSKGQVLDVNIKYMLMEGGWKWNWQCCICVYIHHNPFCCN